MELRETHAGIEDILAMASGWLGGAAGAYRGHVYRVFHYARRFHGSSSRDDELALASAFHDLGIWSDGTFDYLAPSAARAVAYAEERAPTLDREMIASVIENHHKLTRFRARGHADAGAAVEAFRKADRVDVSVGLLRGGLDRAFVREVTATFPYAGFHGLLVRTALAWFVRHPLRPLPMLRW
jgi:hypothetical protein